MLLFIDRSGTFWAVEASLPHAYFDKKKNVDGPLFFDTKLTYNVLVDKGKIYILSNIHIESTWKEFGMG